MPSESYQFSMPVNSTGATLAWPQRDNTYSRTALIDCTAWLRSIDDAITSITAETATGFSLSNVSATASNFNFTQSGGTNNTTVLVSFVLTLLSGQQKLVSIEIPIAASTGNGYVSGHVGHSEVTSTAGNTGTLPALATDGGALSHVTNWPATQNVQFATPPTVNVGNLPNTQPVSGTVNVGNLPGTQPVSGNVGVNNFPANQPVSGTVNVGNLPGTQPVSGTVNVGNLPSTQQVSGNVGVNNFPANQPVSGTVNVGNLPGTQPVSGTVNVGNLPSTQQVSGTIADSNSASFSTVTPITLGGSAVAPGRALGFVITVPGSIVMTLAGSGTLTIPLTTAGGQVQHLTYEVTQIAQASGSNLAGTFWNAN